MGALLDFYAELPRVMKHYAPDKHTTNDVVRQAIIPLSKPGRCALATVMMGGLYTRPKKMVSHSWSNLFRDLVAACVADAMGDCEFSLYAHLLTHNFGGLMQTLRAGGRLEETYWICAFSVSQHNSICSMVPPGDVDSVTREPSPGCSCGAPQYHSTSTPLRWDGQSIPCEMNKFADMMAYVAAKDEGFQHVIAVDAEFQTFTRAWVVAEIAEGHDMGLVQNLKLRCASDLQAHGAALRDLDVRRMRASRPEDVAYILAGIPDKEAFNRHLQGLIFDEHRGLLPIWQGQCALKNMECAGHLAKLLQLYLECPKEPEGPRARECQKLQNRAGSLQEEP